MFETEDEKFARIMGMSVSEYRRLVKGTNSMGINTRPYNISADWASYDGLSGLFPNRMHREYANIYRGDSVVPITNRPTSVIVETPTERLKLDVKGMNTEQAKEAIAKLSTKIQQEIEKSLLTGEANSSNMNSEATNTNHSTGANTMPEVFFEATFRGTQAMMDAAAEKSPMFKEFVELLSRDNATFKLAKNEGNLDRRMFLTAVGDAVLMPPLGFTGPQTFDVTITKGKLTITKKSSGNVQVVAVIEYNQMNDNPTVKLFGLSAPRDVWTQKPVS